MSGKKISQLTEITSVPTNSLFEVVDASDSTNKKVKYQNVVPVYATDLIPFGDGTTSGGITNSGFTFHDYSGAKVLMLGDANDINTVGILQFNNVGYTSAPYFYANFGQNANTQEYADDYEWQMFSYGNSTSYIRLNNSYIDLAHYDSNTYAEFYCDDWGTYVEHYDYQNELDSYLELNSGGSYLNFSNYFNGHNTAVQAQENTGRFFNTDNINYYSELFVSTFFSALHYSDFPNNTDCGILNYARSIKIGMLGASGNDTRIEIDDINELVTITNVPFYTDDADATSNGLTTGQLYKTTTGGITSLNIVP